ncbi:MAG TPA: type III pantothenate kinase, partial [Myxococcota bacterium]|nr:type III pantothenate kinase [Myxococcota bacterium]
MLAAIDVGNTNTVLGFFEGERLVTRFRLASRASTTSDEYACTLDGLLRMSNLGFDRIDALRDAVDAVYAS